MVSSNFKAQSSKGQKVVRKAKAVGKKAVATVKKAGAKVTAGAKKVSANATPKRRAVQKMIKAEANFKPNAHTVAERERMATQNAKVKADIKKSDQEYKAGRKKPDPTAKARTSD